MEENGVLPFMDVVLKRSVSGKIETAVYRKPSHTERYLQFSSYHPPGMKKAVLRSLLARLSYISDEELKKEEFDQVMMVLQENGYPKGCWKSWSKEASSKTFRVVEE